MLSVFSDLTVVTWTQPAVFTLKRYFNAIYKTTCSLETSLLDNDTLYNWVLSCKNLTADIRYTKESTPQVHSKLK